jgi:hypothetical protein
MTATAPGSLIMAEEAEQQQDDAQLALFFGGEALALIDRSKPLGHYTGERLFRDRPKEYRLVVQMLAEGSFSIRHISRVAHVTDDTIKAVSARESIPIAAHKREIGKIAARVARMTAERLEELAPDMNARDAAVAFGIATDKTLLLNGDATARLETVPAAGNIFERMTALYQEMVGRAQEKLADVREVSAGPAEMGLSGGNALANGALEAGGELGADLAAGGLDAGGSDSESVDLRAATLGAVADAAECGAESGPTAGDRVAASSPGEVGGEGVELRPNGAGYQMGNASDDFISNRGSRP